MKSNIDRGLRGGLLAAGFLIVLAGCSNGSSSTPSNNNGGGGTPPPRNSRVYVTNASGGFTSNPNTPDTIDGFTIASIIGGGSTVSPVLQIQSGSFTSAYGIAVDSQANIYITDLGSSSVQVFHNNANGSSVTPFRTITSGAMIQPVGIALDGSNNIYVTSLGGSSGGAGSIVEFSSSQSGNVTPIRSITGSATRLSTPYGVAVRGGTIYVANNGNNSVEIFGAGAKGNVAPLRIISGAASKLNSPFGITVDPNRNIYVSNAGSTSTPGNSITVYGPGGGSTPIRTISGSNTGLVGPAGLALDGNNNLYVGMLGPPSTSQPTGALEVFNAGASGNASPRATLQGLGVAAWGVAVF